MSWLLFLDESGHDHKQMPYEVREGIAMQDSGEGVKDGRVFPCWGIVYVQNPYAPGRT